MRVEDPAEPLAGHSEVSRGDTSVVGRADPTVGAEPEGEHTETAMAEGQHLAGEVGHRRAIIDTDEGVAFDERAVDEHRGELPAQDLLDDGMLVGQREHAEAIDHGVADALALVFVRRAGHEEQRMACALGHAGQRGEELDRVRVGECPREGFGEHDADGTGSAAAQRPACGVRPAVPEADSGLEDALSKIVRELVGTGVRVGDRRARDPDRVGDRLQCDLWRHGLPKRLLGGTVSIKT